MVVDEFSDSREFVSDKSSGFVYIYVFKALFLTNSKFYTY